MSATTPAPIDVRIHFAQLSVQYFIAGRSAAFQQLIPILGNLLHHAVEMALKAHLAQSLTLKQLVAYRHNLPRLWNAFKASVPGTDYSHLDGPIEALHRYESLRYPDSVLEHGALMELSLLREHVGPVTPSPGGIPKYSIVLEDIDETMAVIFKSASLNPTFITGSATQEARQALTRNNRFAHGW